MYLQHWGLDRSPFTTSLASPYPTVPLVEATARADYLVSQRRRMGVLLGGRGWGKTTTLAAIAAEQASHGAAVAIIDAVALTARELLWRSAEGLGAAPDPGDTQMRLWRRIEDRLAENRWQGRSTVLLVDDAQELGPDSQQQLFRLARLESDLSIGADARWTILLATSPDALEQLGESLLHLIDLRIDLVRWTTDDTVGYVQTSLIDAGCYEPIFTDAAIESLQELTQGVPRHVARLADFALLTGANQQAPQISETLIEQAFDETKWSPGGVALAV